MRPEMHSSAFKCIQKHADTIKVSNAFKVISDPIYNGHTSNLNKVLDDLPNKKS